jgi:hypothetical protein
VLQRFQTGDIDAAGVLLLPLLPNLKAVEPPIRGGLCADLFRQVSYISYASATQTKTTNEHGIDILDAKGQKEGEALPFPSC